MAKTNKPKKKQINSISNNTVALILCGVLFVCIGGWTYYRHYRLSKSPTATVTAVITDVYMQPQGGVGYRTPRSQFTCKYTFNGIEYQQSFYFPKEKWEQIHIGDCVEVKISLENKHIFKWNQSKGTFKCDSISTNYFSGTKKY